MAIKIARLRSWKKARRQKSRSTSNFRGMLFNASELALKSTLAKYEKSSDGRNDKQVSTAAITEDLDTGVGKVLEAIDRLGISDNTYVIYMSDNGAGGGKRGGLNGGKAPFGKAGSASLDHSRSRCPSKLLV